MDHKKLGKNVVVIGGGEVGVETAIYLAENGHTAKVLEMLDTLAPDASADSFPNFVPAILGKDRRFQCGS